MQDTLVAGGVQIQLGTLQALTGNFQNAGKRNRGVGAQRQFVDPLVPGQLNAFHRTDLGPLGLRQGLGRYQAQGVGTLATGHRHQGIQFAHTIQSADHEGIIPAATGQHVRPAAAGDGVGQLTTSQFIGGT